ncbi:MAG: Spy/CpxP family protein refolding chaperone [Arcobacteraceae bacterium]|nr:Spy/CpxP family protein refolding chaperone [Arcobacteraceae bacterium]
MKTSKILAGLLVAGVSVAFANGAMGCKVNKDDNRPMKGEKRVDSKNFKKGEHPHHDFMRMFMGKVETLGLTKEQKASIGKIFDENKPKMVTPMEAFSDDKFDAQKFVDIIQNQKLERIKQQADIISKVYDILTPEQKVKFKNEMKDGLPSMRGKCDKSPTFRR